jgi:hypothetical protein
MKAKFTYAIKFVADMEKAVRYHRDVLGLPLRFQSDGWSEFDTGGVTLALHPASKDSPPGKVELGFGVDDLRAVYAAREKNGLNFRTEPAPLHGMLLSAIIDCEGAAVSLSGPE